MTRSGRGLIIALWLVVLAVAAILAESAFAARTHQVARTREVTMASLEHGVLDDINAFRVRHHLAALRLNPELNAAAAAHTREMAAVGYFAHTSANGSAFWQRIQRFYGASSWNLWSVGENLLWSSPSVSPAQALDMWIASPEHLRNLLTARWREIGISAVHVSSAPGTFHGLGVTIVTTDFGVRR